MSAPVPRIYRHEFHGGHHDGLVLENRIMHPSVYLPMDRPIRDGADYEDAPGRLTAVVLDGVTDVSAGSITDAYPVASWRYIDRDEFDRIIGLDEIRRSFGWHE